MRSQGCEASNVFALGFPIRMGWEKWTRRYEYQNCSKYIMCAYICMLSYLKFLDIREVTPAAKRRNARLSFAFIFPDTSDRFVLREVVGLVVLLDLFFGMNDWICSKVTISE
ncbi:hypothetical protein NC651_031736 [Populus alba x Populus x berolinensis]|nr:hypothetical protein NC651_031736 [Populus alba x Populus x berolinensis]